MKKSLLDVKDVSVSFRINRIWYQAIDNISFSLQEGETLCLVGESGCGKSVTALTVLKLLPQDAARVDSGEIQYQGTDLLSLSEQELKEIRGREITMIFQEPMTSLNPIFKVGNQIVEAIQLHQPASRKKAVEQAMEAMTRVGIPDARNRFHEYPHQMSGGMRQRIMIAMALACEPRILMADEPTTALDVTIQAQILELISNLKNQSQMGVLLITHDLGVVAEMADRVAVMYAGVIVELTDVKMLFSNPLHPYTQALYQSLPKTKKGRDEKRLQTIAGRVPSLQSMPSYCKFYDRCALASEECKRGEPELREVEKDHFVRCIKV